LAVLRASILAFLSLVLLMRPLASSSCVLILSILSGLLVLILRLTWLLVVPCMGVLEVISLLASSISVLLDHACFNVEDFLDHLDACFTLEESTVDLVDLELLDHPQGQSHVLKEYCLVLDVLRVHKANFGDSIVLNDDDEVVLNQSAYLLTDLVDARECMTFAL